MRARSLAIAVVGASALAGVAACWVGPAELQSVDWQCQSDAECAQGTVCVASRCVNPDLALRFLTAPIVLAVGQCSGAPGLQIRAEGPPGTPLVATAPITVSLTASNPAPVNAVHFYSSPICNPASEVTSVEIPAGSSDTPLFYMQTTGAGSWTLRGRAPTYGADATQLAQVAPSSPASLAFTTAPQTLALKLCSDPISVEVKDAYGNGVPAGAPTPIALTHNSDSTFNFYSDAACAVLAPSATIPVGSSKATFYVRGTGLPSTVSMTAADGPRRASQDAVLESRTPSKVAFVSPLQTVPRDNCSAPVQVQIQDALGKPAPALSITTVNLSVSPPSAASLFADPICTQPISSRDIAPQLSTAVFYFRGNALGPATISASTVPYGGAQQDVSITAPVPAKLGFPAGPLTLTAGACSAALNIESWSPLNTPAAVFADTVVAFSTPLTVYRDASCTGTPSSTALIPAGSSSATVWVSTTVAGAANVQVSAPGLTAASQTEQVQPGTAAQVVVTSAPQTVTAGVCSAVATGQLRDAYGNVTTAGTPLTANLATAPASAATYYPAAGCAGAISSVAFGAGVSSVQFRFQGTVAQSISLEIDPLPAGMINSAQAAVIAPAAPASLRFTSAPQTVVAGQCSAPVTLESRDAFGNVAPTAAPVTITPSAATLTNMQYFASPDCSGSPVTTLSLPASQSSVTYSFKGTAIGAGTLTATSVPVLTSPTPQPTTIAPAPTVALTFGTVAQAPLAGVCSGLVRLDARDAFGNIAPTVAPVTVPIGVSGLGNVLLYAGAGCTGSAVTDVLLDAAQSSVTYSYRGTLAGSGQLTVSSPLTNPAPQGLTINPAARSSLEFATTAQTVVAGVCSGPVTIQSKDAFGNLNTGAAAAAATVNIGVTTLGSFTLYSDASCLTPATSVLLAAGSSSVAYRFKGNAIGNGTLTASSAALTGPPAQNVSIVPAGPTKLVFFTAGQTVVAGVCSGAVRLDAQDAFNNLAPPPAAVTITLGTTILSGVSFYAGTGCTGAPTSTVTLGAGQTSVMLSFRTNVSGTGTITASSSLAPPPGQATTISPAAPNALRFSTVTPAQTVTAGVCSGAVRLEQVDAFGNLTAGATPAVTVTVGSAALGSITVYSAIACGGTASPVGGTVNITLAAGANFVEYSFRGTLVGAGGLTVASGLNDPGNQTLTISPAAPNALRFSAMTPPQTVTAGTCSGTVRLEQIDAFGNLTTAGALTVTVGSATLGGITVYTGTGCSGTASPLGGTVNLTLAAATNFVTYSFRGTTAGAGSLTAASSLPVDPTQSVTVNPAVASDLVFGSAPQTVTAGTCSGAVQLVGKDAYNNTANASASVLISLIPPSLTGFAFYTNSSCTSGTVTSVTLPAGQNTATVYFKATGAGSGNISFTSSLANDFQAVTIAPGPAVSIVFESAPLAVTIGVCTGPVVLELRDAFGNQVTAAASFTIDLAQTGTPSLALLFYNGSFCGGAGLTQIIFSAGTTSKNYYVRAGAAGTGGLVIPTNSAGLANPANQPITAM